MSSNLIEQVKNDFYTYAEAARTLGITKVTLWRWIKSGKVMAYHLGREVLIEKDVIASFLDDTCDEGEINSMENLIPYRDKLGRQRGAWDVPTDQVCECAGPMIEASIAEEDYEDMTEGQITDYQAGFWKIYLCKDCHDVKWVQSP